jgi:hypothetical protein
MTITCISKETENKRVTAASFSGRTTAYAYQYVSLVRYGNRFFYDPGEGQNR